MNFDKLNKACKEVNETWREMMNENNPFDTISKIAKDIRDREDREMALAFTNAVCSLLKENGVFVKTSRYELETDNEADKNKYIIKKEYGVSFDGLDFTEHDKRFNDKIRQLKRDLEKTYNQLMEVEKESQERIAELESELEVKDNLLKIKNGLCGNFDDLPSEPISVANMLINAKIEYEPTSLQKALFKTEDKCMADKYSDDDLEQIAEHLLVYCKHNKESE